MGFGLRVTRWSVALDKWVILEGDVLTLQSGQPIWLACQGITQLSVPRQCGCPAVSSVRDPVLGHVGEEGG